MNCPGKAACRGCPSAGSRISDVTLLLSRFLRATSSGRNPVQAGGGPAVEAGPRPRPPAGGCRDRLDPTEPRPLLSICPPGTLDEPGQERNVVAGDCVDEALAIHWTMEGMMSRSPRQYSASTPAPGRLTR